MKKHFLPLCLILVFLLSGCDLCYDIITNVTFYPATGDSSTIKGRAYNNAVDFVNSETRYQLGASGRFVYPFDCSGLVIRCYSDALEGTGLSLPFNFTNTGHPSAQQIYDNYSIHTNKPEKGDLIFLNFNRDGPRVTHIGIFEKYTADGRISFIDATDYWKYDKVVDFRKIERGNKAIIGFGAMKFAY